MQRPWGGDEPSMFEEQQRGQWGWSRFSKGTVPGDGHLCDGGGSKAVRISTLTLSDMGLLEGSGLYPRWFLPA